MTDTSGQQNNSWDNSSRDNARTQNAGPAAETALNQSFSTGDTCRVIVDNPRGLIRVVGWDRPEVYVRATKLPDSSLARFQATRVTAEQHGNIVHLRTVVEPDGAFSPSGTPQSIAQEVFQAISEFVQQRKPAAVEYDVRVPRRAALEFKSVSADVDVQNVTGSIRTNTVSGSIGLEAVNSDVVLHSVSGNLAAQNLNGRLDVNTVSGDINVLGHLDASRVNSVSGSIELAGPLNPSSAYDFHSVSGGVTLRLPADSRVSVAVRGVSADVNGDLPTEVLVDTRRPGSREWKGLLNGGGASVNFQTVSGRVRLLRWTPSAGPTSPSASPTWGPPSTASEATTSTSAAPQGEGKETTTTADPTPASAPPGFAAPTGFGFNESRPPAQSGDQLEILRALERGELGVDEALRRLEGLRGNNPTAS